MLVLLMATVILMLGGAGWHISVDYDRRIEAARSGLHETAHKILQQVHRTLLGADYILQRIAAAKQNPHQMAGPVAEMDLRALTRVIPGGKGIWVFDAAGNLLAGGGIDGLPAPKASGSVFLAAHEAGRESVMSQGGSTPGLVQLSRRLAGPRGEFAGIAVTQIQPGGMPGQDAAQLIALFNGDGSLLWRQGALGPGPNLEATAASDEMPVSVGVALPRLSVLSAWHARVGDVALIGLATALLLVGLGGLAMRALRSEREVRHELAVANASLEIRVAERTGEALAQKVQAERANEAKSRILEVTSHDLRQPLQAARLFLDILMIKENDPAQRDIAARAVEAIHAGGAILDALVEVAALDSGSVRPKLAAIHVRSLLEELAEEWRPAAREKGLSFHLTSCSDWVHTDRDLLRRILGNMLANAVRFTPEGRVLVGCRRGRGGLRIEVWDTGIGITPRDLNVIFEDFHQVGNSERDRTQGLGLGLSVAQRAARLLGHSVDVKSWPGRGSVFSVTVPIADASLRVPVAA